MNDHQEAQYKELLHEFHEGLSLVGCCTETYVIQKESDGTTV